MITMRKAWYRVSILFMAQVKKDFKELKEEYILRAESFGNAQDILQGYVNNDGEYIKGIIEDRIPNGFLKSMSIIEISDLYVKPSVDGVDSKFYLAKAIIDGGERKYTETHITNANSPNNTIDRVKSRLKKHDSNRQFEIVEVKLLVNIKGLYDADEQTLVEDFAKRQEHIKQNGYSQYIPTQQTIPGTERGYNDRVDNSIIESDPNAITAMVIANGVTEVETEDLNNGTDDDSGQILSPVLQLVEGATDVSEDDSKRESPTISTSVLSENSGETFPEIQDKYKTPSSSVGDSVDNETTDGNENADVEETMSTVD